MLLGAGTIGALGAIGPARALAGHDSAAHAHDWDWLIGSWDVWHRRLKERLAGSTEWEQFPGKSVLWLALDGLATIDDNIVDLPAGSYRGLTVRTFDPASGKWSIWWLDGRNPTVIDAPVRGGFTGDSGVFAGPDTFKGKPIIMRFRWLDIHSRRPHWEQAFSPDGGASWEVNWENFFTRTAAIATPLPSFADHPRDFDFLHGSWTVRHRRRKARLTGNEEWETFSGTLDNRPVLGGHGNIGDNLFALPSGMQRGIGLRAYDPTRGEWLSWWLDGRAPASFAPPLRGRFAGGIGTFEGEELLDGRPVRTRVLWSRITPRSARWEQAMSGDGGTTWETNWISDFVRRS
ncbi:hypothetical protein MZO42_03215 [Sphingomonas psychrotolerans]|uniref:DUF1579 domain-containing protein n=1 Tax=Sphingomonas psychrotolerans TaxID=1327635 RepID=A0ABU3MZQ7_9SPHN|nr:hypothetical protein [Sphingomonas psychrotolerans]MDT8757698.1 hypothetical protein [Sphingomonas psychrotolerans]